MGKDSELKDYPASFLTIKEKMFFMKINRVNEKLDRIIELLEEGNKEAKEFHKAYGGYNPKPFDDDVPF